MAKKKNWYYVLVMTDNGPVFVTDVDNKDKVAHWDKTEKPTVFEKFWAEDLTLGLNLNGYMAFTVCSKIELDTQPYNYKKWHIEWKENEEEVTEE